MKTLAGKRNLWTVYLNIIHTEQNKLSSTKKSQSDLEDFIYIDEEKHTTEQARYMKGHFYLRK
jgi:hypothetical protein